MGTLHIKLMQLLALLALFSITSALGKTGFDSKLIASEVVTEKDNSHTLYGTAGFIKCTSDKLVEPVGTQDISELLQKLNADGRPFKVRATRRGRHTPNRFACAGKGGSAKSPTDAAVRNGMSVPVGVLPVYGNLTVGGVISSSAHGTGAGVDSSLHHQCYCTEDSHCADGYKCLPSVSYPEYKVCKVQFPEQTGDVRVKEEL
ncbi:hypothetical protein R1sor_003145 [Riccia sorocarpa]|uniref:L-gulonolactone oxidase 2-like C-terminal domain-containing protein n=1 Tax=Riccia sorocarpa TaxID=122646 RepID=A0ABD3H162_9MARC